MPTPPKVSRAQVPVLARAALLWTPNDIARDLHQSEAAVNKSLSRAAKANDQPRAELVRAVHDAYLVELTEWALQDHVQMLAMFLQR